MMARLYVLLRGQQTWLGTAIAGIVVGIALLIAASGDHEQQQLLNITRNTAQASLPDLLNRQRTASDLDLLRYQGDIVAYGANLSDRRRAMAAAQLIASRPAFSDEQQLAALLDESVALLAQLVPDGSGRDAMRLHWAQLSGQLGANARQIVGDSAQQLMRQSEDIENIVAQSRIRLVVILGAMALLIWLSLHLTRRHAGTARAFRTLAEHSPDAISRYDRDCRHIYVNPTVARIRGVPAAVLLGKTPLDGLPGNALGEQQLACVQQVLSSGTALEAEAVWTATDGTQRTSHVRYVPEHDRDGVVISVLAIGRDITRLKEIEQELLQSRDSLRSLMAHQEKNREEERKRAAWEVHEELGQNLVALRMHLSMSEQGQSTRDLLDRSIQVVRSLTASLHPRVLDLGVVLALEWLADKFSKQTAIPCALHLDAARLPMGEEYATAIFRIAEEALDNVARHAEATRVDVTLERREHSYFLGVQDDGKGFDFDMNRGKCLGLLAVQERARALGGEAVITSAPGTGTAIKVRIPRNA